jgi:hypothetical protein
MFIEGGTDEKRCGGEEEAGGGEAAQGAAQQGPEGAEQGGHQLLEEEQDRGGPKRILESNTKVIFYNFNSRTAGYWVIVFLVQFRLFHGRLLLAFSS